MSTVSSAKYGANFYVGNVMDHDDSEVEGYLTKDGLSLIFGDGNETYYVEPSSNYFADSLGRNSAIIYRASDVKSCNESNKKSSSCNRFTNYDLPNLLPNSGISTPRPDSLWNQTKHRDDWHRTCGIELVADHTYVAYMKYNIKDIITVLYFHAKRADNVFKRADFNMNGHPDFTRIVPAQILIYWDDRTPGYPFAGTSMDSPSDYILASSKRVQSFCLSVCFCSRVFKDDVIGMAYKANADNPDAPGGICETPIILPDSTILATNTAFISTAGQAGHLPLSVTVHSFIHELGHCFGSEHDDPKDEECSPGGEHGNYIMTPNTIDGSKLRHAIFSPCSRRTIGRVIDAKGHCLQKMEVASCGNGIKELGEECDCGNTFTCSKLDPCCKPKGVSGECTFRRGAECSFVDSPCCSSECKIVKAQMNKICTRDPASCLEATCNGLSAECLAEQPMKNGSVCGGFWRTCSGGVCNSSVCLDHGMDNCRCLMDSECQVCCRNQTSGICGLVQSFEWFNDSIGNLYWKSTGMFCRGGTGICNKDGSCELLITKELHSKSPLQKLYSVILPVSVAVIIFTIPLTYALIKRVVKRKVQWCNIIESSS